MNDMSTGGEIVRGRDGSALGMISIPPRIINEPTLIDGTWTYPMGDAWTPERRAEFEGAVGNLIHEERERERIAAAGAAKLTDPALIIAAKRAEVDAAKRAREQTERAAKGRIAWVQAKAAHGSDVDMFETVEGDFVIVLFMSAEEVAAAERKIEILKEAAVESVTAQSTKEDIRAAEMRLLAETTGTWKDATLAKTTIGGLAPDESRARLKYLMSRYGSIWPKLVAVRDGLVMGFRSREGKDSALS